MIKYKNRGHAYFRNLVRLSSNVLPWAGAVAFPCGMLAFFLRAMIDRGVLPLLAEEGNVIKESQAWSGFNFLVGFLIVFRTSQSYNRFWEASGAIYKMQAEWFDTASALVAFTTTSKAPAEDVVHFKHCIVRLLSMLHASALGSLESAAEGLPLAAFSYEMIDPSKLAKECRTKVKNTTSRAELIFTWVNNTIVKNQESGVLAVAPPILSRAFQTLSNGMQAYHDAGKIVDIPYPLPYAQTCDMLLVLHWLISPVVFSQFSQSPFWSAVFCFSQVFVFWALNMTAREIENPFGQDVNDLDLHSIQKQVNLSLQSLLHEDVLMVPTLDPGFREAFKKKSLELHPTMSAYTRTAFSDMGGTPHAFNSDSGSVEFGVFKQPGIRKTVEGHGELLDAQRQWEAFDRSVDFMQRRSTSSLSRASSTGSSLVIEDSVPLNSIAETVDELVYGTEGSGRARMEAHQIIVPAPPDTNAELCDEGEVPAPPPWKSQAPLQSIVTNFTKDIDEGRPAGDISGLGPHDILEPGRTGAGPSDPTSQLTAAYNGQSGIHGQHDPGVRKGRSDAHGQDSRAVSLANVDLSMSTPAAVAQDGDGGHDTSQVTWHSQETRSTAITSTR